MNLFELYATLGLKDDGFNKGINDATGKTEGFTAKVGNLVQAVAGVKVVSAAFDMVRDSIGSAVDRADTLNRFPKIMELMEKRTYHRQEDMAMVFEALRGCLDGLKQQNCNGEVTKALTKLNSYISNKTAGLDGDGRLRK